MTTTTNDLTKSWIPQPEHDWDPPRPVWIGEVGEMIAFAGHIDKRIAELLVAVECIRTAGMVEGAMQVGIRRVPQLLDADEPDDADDADEPDPVTFAGRSAMHVWALITEETDQTPEGFMRWADVTADTPGARPITVVNLG